MNKQIKHIQSLILLIVLVHHGQYLTAFIGIFITFGRHSQVCTVSFNFFIYFCCMASKRCVPELGSEAPFLCYHTFNLFLLLMAVYEHQLNFSVTVHVSLIFGKMMLHLE